jgi:hypothetical protein
MSVLLTGPMSDRFHYRCLLLKKDYGIHSGSRDFLSHVGDEPSAKLFCVPVSLDGFNNSEVTMKEAISTSELNPP